jgi:hypothetical protein
MNTIDRFAVGTAALHFRLWPGVLAGLAIVWLLLAFHDVARGAVQQGELRRQATAEQARAAWRSKSANAPPVGNGLRVGAVPQDVQPQF